jgi:GxxExxY protein
LDRRDEIAAVVVDAAIEVHRTLGPGYAESIYENAMAIELESREMPFERQVQFDVAYKTRLVGLGAVDIIVDRLVIVELKAVSNLLPVHLAQAISYLKATGLPLALLMNFDERYMKDGIRRVVLTRRTIP